MSGYVAGTWLMVLLRVFEAKEEKLSQRVGPKRRRERRSSRMANEKKSFREWQCQLVMRNSIESSLWG